MRSKSPGFSLVEIMIVIMIVGVLITLFVPNIRKAFGRLTSLQIQRQLTNWQEKINSYYIDTNYYPETLQDLTRRPQGPAAEGWRGDYVEEAEMDNFPPVDKNENPLVYNKPPQMFKKKYKKYELYSLGTAEADDPDPAQFMHVGV